MTEIASRFLVLIVTLCLTGSFAAGSEPLFRRGINASSIFTYPVENSWPPFQGERTIISDRELEALAEIGFDFIRLPVDPTPFHDLADDRRRVLLQSVANFVRRANTYGLAVIVSGHPTHSETAWRPEEDGAAGRRTFAEYAEWLEEVTRAVEAVADYPQAAIALMNEPQAVCVNEVGRDWDVYQLELHRRVRSITSLPIVLTGGCWSQIDGLAHISIPPDPNTLFDVHYYEPFSFTHQGATWATPWLAYVTGLHFPPDRTRPTEAILATLDLIQSRHPGDEDEKREMARHVIREIMSYEQTEGIDRVARDFRRLEDWARRNSISPSRVLIGEFGAIRVSSPSERFVTSRTTYLRTVRQAAEKKGFGWAMWEYFSPFELVEDDRRFSRPVVEALGLGVVE